MKELEFTRRDTAIIKGIAIILMFLHHLFAFPNRIQEGVSYISLFSLAGTNVEYFAGIFGSICVAMFLFLSGFGMYKKVADNREDTIPLLFKQLKRLYVSYWIIFVIFIPISFFMGIRQFSFNELFNNIIGYESTYDGEWWFFQLYVLVIITFPITINIIRNSAINSITNIIIINVVTRTILPSLVQNDILANFSKSFFYNKVYLLLCWMPCFLMGCIFAKFNILPKIRDIFKYNKIDNIVVYTLICLIIAYIRYRVYSDYTQDFDYLVAPAFIIAGNYVVKVLKLDKLFALLGRHSTNMWLMHSFFCYQYFQRIVYYPKISFLIVLWLTVLCVTCSWIIIHITKEGRNILEKIKDKQCNKIELNNAV